MLRSLRAIEGAIDAVLQRVAVAGIVALIAVMSLQIVSRVLFTATSWSEETARYLLIWLTFLGACLAYHRGRHIAVSVLADALPPHGRRICQGLIALVTIAFMSVLLQVGLEYMALQSFQQSAALRIPMSVVYAVMPLSAAIMAYMALTDLLDAILGQPGDATGGRRP
ncbi:TRAP transporter small permease [Spiribacter sp. 1M153]|nr:MULTISPECIES: TRAP transporter small permease [Spiribacter]KAF0280144.1 C4-dicarboxylate ABC transporter permease [Spiribacter roseus]